jgi:hypothetical protein
MSNKITSIHQAWANAIDNMIDTLEALSWQKTLYAAQRKNLNITTLEGDPCAFDLEWHLFSDIKEKLKTNKPFTANDIQALLYDFTEIAETYKAVDQDCLEEFENRKTVVFQTMIDKNKRLNRGTKPTPTSQKATAMHLHQNLGERLNVPFINVASTLKNNAKVMIDYMIWDETYAAQAEESSIRNGYIMERSAIRKLDDMIESGKHFDTASYTAHIMFFRDVHEKYKHNTAIEAEFAQRQTKLKSAMRFLYEHHKDTNLFTNDSLEAKRQADKQDTMPTHPENGVPLDQAKEMRELALQLVDDLGPATQQKPKPKTSNIVTFPSPNNGGEPA